MFRANNSDSRLLKDLHKGSAISFDELFRLYNKKIYSFSLSYLKNKEDAENTVQEVFLTLWRKRDGLNKEHDLNSYIFTIAYNVIRKYFRKAGRENKYVHNYGKMISIEDDSTNAEIEYNNLIELASEAIQQLPKRQKTIYNLHTQEGLSCEEISTRLGISKRTVDNHLYRAKLFLKKSLSDHKLLTLLFICLFI